MGQKIRNLRKIKNLTQAELAEIIGMHEVSVRSWESDSKAPNSSVMLKLAVALDTSVGYLVGETEDPKRYQSLLMSEDEQTGDAPPTPPFVRQHQKITRQLLEKHVEESQKILNAMAGMIPPPIDPIIEKQIEDPEKAAIIKMLEDLDKEQIKKVHDFLYDQKQLAKFLKEKEA
jgi:transcriptional regulator with XRE-family HTH domain